MKKLLMIKYGELTTKKDNRSFFINTLSDNIKSALSNININIIKDYYRMFIETEDIDASIEKLKNIFGIHEIALTYFSEKKNIESIYELSNLFIEEGNTFKVETNRSDKNYPIKSMEISKKVGAFLLKNNNNLKVDVKNPEKLINIEIRKEGIYVYSNTIKGKGGYPTGTLGKALLMLSGGIDSIVAGYLTMKRGVRLDFIYFESLPHTSLEARKKVEDLARLLTNYGNTGKLYVVNFTKIQESIYKNMDKNYMITLMRRQMYKIAEKIAIKTKCNAIVNGESIGQVASQTLTSIKVVNDVTNYPIIRPLAAFDKLDIIEIAKKIGSYNISILPYEDCCTIFVPTHPVINPTLEHAREEEKKLDNYLIKDAINDILVIELNKKEAMDDLL